MKNILLSISFLFLSFIGYSQANDFSFVHTATAENSYVNYSIIDHPLMNNQPGLKVLCTHNLSGGGAPVYTDEVVRIAYFNSVNKWGVLNSDSSEMEAGSAYNIYVMGTAGYVIDFLADVDVYQAEVDDPLLNGNPSARPVVANPYSVSLNDKNYGMYFNNSANRWYVYAEDISNIPANSYFKILVKPVFVSENPDISFTHLATATNITGNYTTIDHPLLNDNPNAVFVMSHVYNADDYPTSGVIFDKTIGAWYNSFSGRWTIYTEDGSDFTVHTAFNVSMPYPTISNDEPVDSLPLTVGDIGECNYTTISNIGASDTSANGVPFCGQYLGGDVWYHFYAPSTGNIMIARERLEMWSSLGYAIYEHQGDTVPLACGYILGDDTEDAGVYGLTPGQIYGLRVWEGLNDNFGDENICIREIADPVGNDECSDAINLNVQYDTPSYATSSPYPGTIAGATNSGLPAEECEGDFGTANDDVWYKFTPNSTSVNITLEDNFDGILNLFSGTCGDLDLIYCDDFGSMPQVSPDDLIVGEEYFIRVFSYEAGVSTTPNFNIAIWEDGPGVGIAENEIDGLAIFPNPAADVLYFTAKEDIKSILIYNTLGQELLNCNPFEMQIQLDVSQFTVGIYLVKLQVGNALGTYRFVKE